MEYGNSLLTLPMSTNSGGTVLMFVRHYKGLTPGPVTIVEVPEVSKLGKLVVLSR